MIKYLLKTYFILLGDNVVLGLSDTTVVILVYLIFILFCVVITYIKNYINSDVNNFDIEAFLPKHEFHYLKQVFYLVMSGLFLIGFFALFFLPGIDFTIFLIDFIISIIAIIYIIDKKPWKFILSLLILPCGSLLFVMGIKLPFIIYAIHYVGMFVMVGIFIQRFLTYTRDNNLGLTAILFIGILVVSFAVTLWIEKATFLDSLVMVSNAFTSNGYTILGNTSGGKLASILLVWGGYLLSGVGTATLAATIINASFRRKFKEQEDQISNLKEKIISVDTKNDILLEEIRELKDMNKR